jgi:hypothetical protein
MKRIFTTILAFGLAMSASAQVLVQENFDAGIPVTWTVVDNLTDGATWGSNSSRPLDGTPTAIVDSDADGNGIHMIEELITPAFDGTGYSQIILEFDQWYNNIGPDYANVDVWDGASWVNVLNQTADVGGNMAPDHQLIDITAYANPAMQVRFFYDDNNSWAWYWSVDNVEINGVNCPLITSVTGSNISFDQADINWTSSAINVDIEWGAPGFAPGTGAEIGSITNTTNNPQTITGLAQSATYDVYVRSNCGGIYSAWEGYTFTTLAQYDGYITAISAPSGSCGLTNAEMITLELANDGGDTIFTFDVCYTFNAGIPVCETVNDIILPGGTYSHTFASTEDLSAFATYTFDASITVVGDLNTANDVFTGYSVTHSPTVSSFPYLEDFEGGQGDWTINNSNGGNWEFGTPSNTIINSAESGTNAFVTGLNSLYPGGMNDYVESPCFDFTSATGQEVFAMDVWWESENGWDGANVSYSLDGGVTWQQLGSVAGAAATDNWYNDASINADPGTFPEGWSGRNGSGSNGWVQSKWDLDSATFVGEFVKFRVNFGSDGIINDEGFAFDNVAIAYPIMADIYPDSMNICDTSFATNLSSLGIYDDAIWSDGQTGLDVEIDNSGTYDVIAYDVYGMSVMDTFILELNENFIAPDLGPDRVLCFGNSETLDAGWDSGNSYSYVWNDASTDTTLMINSGGIYAVTKSDTAGCVATDSVTITMPAPAQLGPNTQGFCAGDSITLDPGVINAQSYQWSTGANTQTINVSAAGGYSVVVTDSLGCATIDAVSVLESTPMPDLGNDPTVLCVNTNTTLDPGTFDAYSWSTGDNTQTILVQGSVFGLGNHTFTVTVVDSLGCTAQSSVTVQFEDCVGIDEVSQAQLSIYPNPSADGVFNYEVEGLSGEFNLYVTDITGKTISNLDNTNSVVGVIDLSTFERGVYFLNIVANGDRKTVRLIKQ